MQILLFEPRLCTKHELDTIYSLEDLYDFQEIIDVKTALEDEMQKMIAQKQQQAQARK